MTSVQSACAYAHVHPGTVHVHDVLAYARIVLYYAYIRRLRLAWAARRVCTCAMCISGHAWAGGPAGGVILVHAVGAHLYCACGYII